MTTFTPPEKMVIRYLRGLGMQQSDVASLAKTSRQVIAYQLNTMRNKLIDKGELPGLKQAGGLSPLVGYVSTPCPPSLECNWCDPLAMGEAPEANTRKSLCFWHYYKELNKNDNRKLQTM